MTSTQIGMVALGHSDLVLASQEDDVRGKKVLDPDGHRVGEVSEIVVDEQERRARLLVVASGGLLGLGVTRRLVPVEDVAHVGEDVRLRTDDSRVRAGQDYDPELADPPDYAQVYSYYGYTPFWIGSRTSPYLHDVD